MSLKGHIFGLVQPLLDITMEVSPSYLDQYHLAPNNGILATEEHAPIYMEMLERSQEFGVRFSPGGTTQNTMRVTEWLLGGEEGVTSIAGCVGADTVGSNMLNLMQSERVTTHYETSASAPTGLCAVLVTPGNNRSMVTRLGAGRNFTLDHLLSSSVWRLVEQARILYINGFMLNDCQECVTRIGQHSADEGKCFVFNLSAPYLSKVFKEECRRAVEFSDIVIGNSDEARALACNFGMMTSSSCDDDASDLHGIIREIAALPKVSRKRERMVVITQGAGDILVFENGNVREFPVSRIPSEEIVDTNGAGDAFVGGFLSELVRGRGVDVCVEKGVKAAHLIMRQPGCTLPAKLPGSSDSPVISSSSSENPAKPCADSVDTSPILDKSFLERILLKSESRVVAHGIF